MLCCCHGLASPPGSIGEGLTERASDSLQLVRLALVTPPGPPQTRHRDCPASGW
jgi:hypothetical protein